MIEQYKQCSDEEIPEVKAINKCKHSSIKVEFDSERARGMSVEQVRKIWPRFNGTCPECKELVIIYASIDHYILGDY
jgi:hypothetical protein